jgi:hypothetical protein
MFGTLLCILCYICVSEADDGNWPNIQHFNYNMKNYVMCGRAVAQAVSRWLPTAPS